MVYNYYNFPKNVIKIGGCLERSLSYFGLKPLREGDKTIQNLLDTLKYNNIIYVIKEYNEKDFENEKGFLIFKGNGFSSHIAVFEKGIYYDSYNHKKKPDFIIILGWLPAWACLANPVWSKLRKTFFQAHQTITKI